MSQVKVTADSGGGTVAWKAPATTTSNAAVVLTLPVDDGAANKFLKSNGSGVTSWAGPTASEIATTSGTASASTYLCGNNTWGTPSGGKILQIVQTVKTDASSEALSGGDGNNGQSSWTDISGMTASITPSATTSKVLVQYNAWVSTDSGPDNLFIRLLRGSTVINVGDTNGNRTEATSGHWQNTAYNVVQHTTNFIDSPSTTSATTYKLQWADWYNNTVWINRAYNSNDYSYHYTPNSTITLWEVGA